MIKSAKHLTSHILNIEFNDRHHETVDFSTFIYTSGHPGYEKYKSINKFLKHQIIDGSLNWGDYTMIFQLKICITTK